MVEIIKQGQTRPTRNQKKKKKKKNVPASPMRPTRLRALSDRFLMRCAAEACSTLASDVSRARDCDRLRWSRGPELSTARCTVRDRSRLLLREILRSRCFATDGSTPSSRISSENCVFDGQKNHRQQGC